MLAGCSSEQKPFIVWSNEPDVAFIIEHYNAEAQVPAEFRYTANPAQSFLQEERVASVVVGRNLNNPDVLNGMKPMDQWYLEEGIDPTRPFVRAQRFNESVRLVPLAYELPAIVWRSDRIVRTGPLTISLQTLDSQVAKFVRTSDGSYGRLAFAPTYQPDGIYEIARASGFSVSAAPTGQLRFNDQGLISSLTDIQQWTMRHNHSIEAEREFVAEYLYDPLVRHLERGRIVFAYMESSDLLRWSFWTETSLDYRWLADEQGMITPLEDVVWLGVPAAASNADAALHFSRWITQPENQRRVMQSKISQRMDSFGLFGGFPAISNPTDTGLNQLYPQVAGRIPPRASLRELTIQPKYWNEAREDVVQPGMDDLTNPETAVREIQEQLQLWYKQRGD